MSKKDYLAFANILRDRKNHIEGLTTQANQAEKQDEIYLASLDSQYYECEYYTKELADLFILDNPKFDRQRFYIACGFENL